MPARGKAPESSVDHLFQLPLEEFTAARNVLAAKLKKSGHADQADQIKALGKPPVSTWAVNQLYWRHRKAFDALLAAGEQFRQAQAAQLGGQASDLRGTLDARREALSALTRLAATLLRAAGHTPGPDTMRRVTTTLEALGTYGATYGATDGAHPDAPAAGRLTNDVDAPGFEALATLVPQVGDTAKGGGEKGGAAPRILTFHQQAKTGVSRKKLLSPGEAEQQQAAERRARLAAARAAIDEADKGLREARKSAERAEAALKKAAGLAKEAEQARAELDARVEKLAAVAEAAKQDARRVAADAENAAQAVEDAERAVEKAKRELAAVE